MSDAGRARGSSLMFENVRQALQILAMHKLRSSLLILGVAIGVASILAVVAILLGLSEKIDDDFAAADQPYISVTRYDVLAEGRGADRVRNRPQLSPEETADLREKSRLSSWVDYRVNSESGRLFQLTAGSRKTQPLSMVGTSEAFPNMHPFDIEHGRFFTRQEVERRRPVIVLAWGPSEALFPNVDPVGRTVRAGEREYTVVGTMARRRTLIGAMGDAFAIIPHTTYHRDLYGEGDEGQIVVTPAPNVSLDQATEEIIALLRGIRHDRPGAESSFEVLSSEAFSETLGRVTGAVGLVLVIISSIGLLVGGIGVMNIMLVSVTQRTHEVGIRMAIGARRRDVLTQFLVESATLTGIGGVAGIAVGLGIAYVVTEALRFPFKTSPLWIAIAVLFSAGIGILFGLYPANRAARMDPIEALRSE